MSLPPEIVAPRDKRGSKLGDLIRRLSTNSDGEIVATVYAIRRILRAFGADFHEVAEHLEVVNGKHNGGSDEQLQKVWDAAYARGVQDTENRQHGIDDFISTDGKPTWEGVALFLQRNKHRLDPRHHEFIDDMAGRTAWEEEPTERQHRYLHSLFFKLGGKIT